jgi:hypothetical protein
MSKLQAYIPSCLLALAIGMAIGCSPAQQNQESVAPLASKREANTRSPLAIEKDGELAVVSQCDGEDILIILRSAPYPENSAVRTADSLCFGEPMVTFREDVLDSVSISFKGKYFHIPVSESILFPDASVRLASTTPELPDGSVSFGKDSIDYRVGVAIDTKTNYIAVAFKGSDGEGSYFGSIIIDGSKLIGVAMEHFDSEELPRDFARRSFGIYKKI